MEFYASGRAENGLQEVTFPIGDMNEYEGIGIKIYNFPINATFGKNEEAFRMKGDEMMIEVTEDITEKVRVIFDRVNEEGIVVDIEENGHSTENMIMEMNYGNSPTVIKGTMSKLRIKGKEKYEKSNQSSNYIWSSA